MADLNVLVPELDIPAPLRAPVLVEIDQDVQAALNLSLRYLIEINMYVEVTARSGLVDAAADEFVVGEQVGDLEDRGEQAHEFGGRQGAVELCDRLGELARVSHLDLLLLVDRLEGPADLRGLLERGKRLEHPVGELLVEEAVDGEVRERRGLTNAPLQLIAVDGFNGVCHVIAP